METGSLLGLGDLVDTSWTPSGQILAALADVQSLLGGQAADAASAMVPAIAHLHAQNRVLHDSIARRWAEYRKEKKLAERIL
eukprot:gene15579-biopygen8802